jgi:hypothetical protein
VLLWPALQYMFKRVYEVDFQISLSVLIFCRNRK